MPRAHYDGIIGLIVDHPKRDLAGLVLVAHHLASMKLRSALVPMYQQGIDIPLLKASPVLVNYARENNRAVLQGYARQQRSVAVLDAEGGVLSKSGARSPENWARYTHEGGMAPLITRYFFWGAVVRDAFLANDVLPPEKTIVTGCARYDLCSGQWRSTLGEEAADYLLVNTNFSLVNPLLSSGEAAVKATFKSVGHADEFIDELYSDTMVVFRRFLGEIRRIIATHRSERFVLRPHPFEKSKIYEEHLEGLANVRIDPRGDVLTAISRAKAVIHVNCGSAIEANLLRRVPLHLQYLSTPLQDDYTPLPRKLSLCLSSPAHLDRTLSNIDGVSASYDFEGQQSAALVPFFGPLDGHAARRVAEQLAELSASEPASVGRRIRWAARSGVAKPSLGQVLQGAVGTVFGTRVLASLRSIPQPSRGAKRFNVGDVNRLLTAFARCTGRAPASAKPARHPFTGVPLESVIIESRSSPEVPDYKGPVRGKK
jgi:surface carbohydrate biosynthesis protein